MRELAGWRMLSNRVTLVSVLSRYLLPCCFAALHLLGCGGQAQRGGMSDDSATDTASGTPSVEEQPSGTQPDEPSSVPSTEPDSFYSTPAAEKATPDDECYVPEPRPIPSRNDCATTALACESGSDGCLFTPLAVTLEKLLLDSCNVYCGELAVGTTQGFVTLVENPTGNVSDIECVRQHLLGKRWECAPSEGMARVYLGSCTIL